MDVGSKWELVLRANALLLTSLHLRVVPRSWLMFFPESEVCHFFFPGLGDNADQDGDSMFLARGGWREGRRASPCLMEIS